MRVAVLLVLPVVLEWLPLILIPMRSATLPKYAPVLWLFGTFEACVLAATYRELCALREGPRPEQLGAIFS